ncbi:MAG: serine protease [Candidatus Thiodiazotropha endolucinida]
MNISTKQQSVKRSWAEKQFRKYRSSVAYIETIGDDDKIRIGTCFHVGEGIFVTARHVIENKLISNIGFDDGMATLQLLERPENWGEKSHGEVSILKGPFFHENNDIDVACFKAEPYPRQYIPLGGHLDNWLGQYELVLYSTLLMGYPPIPFSDRPVLVASAGEVNALIDKYTGGHPHFIVSSMARGGFSGGPALVAYNEQNEETGTAALGLVTESLASDGQAAELGYTAVLTVEPIYRSLEKNGVLPQCQHFSISG